MWTADSEKGGAGNSDDSSIVQKLVPHHVHHREGTPTGETKLTTERHSPKEQNIKHRAYRHTISTYAHPPDPPPAPQKEHLHQWLQPSKQPNESPLGRFDGWSTGGWDLLQD